MRAQKLSPAASDCGAWKTDLVGAMIGSQNTATRPVNPVQLRQVVWLLRSAGARPMSEQLIGPAGHHNYNFADSELARPTPSVRIPSTSVATPVVDDWSEQFKFEGGAQ